MTRDQIRETHIRLARLIYREGTDQERKAMADDYQAMKLLRDAFPGSDWEPMAEVVLPDSLSCVCVQVASRRYEHASHLSPRHGNTQRSLEGETRAAKAQAAGCLALGIDFGLVNTPQAAKARGNIGQNVSVFIPKPGHFNLLVGEKEPPDRTMLLVHEAGKDRFQIMGWIETRRAQQECYQHEFTRAGVVSRPYLVPPSDLSPIKEWESVLVPA